jgi:hypothetical protein
MITKCNIDPKLDSGSGNDHATMFSSGTMDCTLDIFVWVPIPSMRKWFCGYVRECPFS